jgi:hypothetical protein
VDPFYIADTGFPWRTVGRLDVSGGWGTGVLVGPRHVLTAAHVLPWRSSDPQDGVAGPVRFVPAAFDALEPYGVVNAVEFACLMVTSPPTIDSTEERLDYAVCVLEAPIGRVVGWMGVKAYRDAWDGIPCWSHLGYRGSHALGTRPSYQSGIALDGHDDSSTRTRSCTTAPTRRRASPAARSSAGGRGVVPQRGRGPELARADISGASGGDRLVELVARSRAEHDEDPVPARLEQAPN